MPLPQALGGSAGSSLDYYINYLTNTSQPGYYDETDTRAAEMGAATGQGFSGARGSLLRRSQRENAIRTVLPLLQQRAQFSHQTASQTQSEAAQLQQIAAQGKLALERDQLREQGLLRHDTAELAQRDKQSIQQGQDAMQRLQLSLMSGEREGAAGRTSNEKIAADRNMTSNYQFMIGEQNKAYENNLSRSFDTTKTAGTQKFNAAQNALNSALELRKTSLMAPGTFDKIGADNLVNDIIKSNGLVKTGGAPASSGFIYDGSGGGSDVTLGNPQGPNEGTGEGTVSQPSYFFGTNSPNTNALGLQNNPKPYWSVGDPFDEDGNWYEED